HAASSVPVLLPPDLPLECLSPQPNSTWPRIREPAATVSEPALTSPISAPDASTSTFCADSMLPSSSPAMMTVCARTPPVSLAPVSMVRLPCTLTSPLNLPAIRTWPVPSILPSMVRSAAISDSFNCVSPARCGVDDAAGVGAGACAAGLMSRTGDGSNWAASGEDAGAGDGEDLDGVVSFQMAMMGPGFRGTPNLHPLHVAFIAQSHIGVAASATRQETRVHR